MTADVEVKDFNIPTREHPKVADTLDKAADYIEQRGWCQGALRTSTGEVCAIGAIRAVTPSTVRRVLAKQALSAEVGSRMVAAWNDSQDPKRGKDVVTRALRRTARKLRGAKR